MYKKITKVWFYLLNLIVLTSFTVAQDGDVGGEPEGLIPLFLDLLGLGDVGLGSDPYETVGFFAAIAVMIISFYFVLEVAVRKVDSDQLNEALNVGGYNNDGMSKRLLGFSTLLVLSGMGMAAQFYDIVWGLQGIVLLAMGLGLIGGLLYIFAGGLIFGGGALKASAAGAKYGAEGIEEWKEQSQRLRGGEPADPGEPEPAVDEEHLQDIISDEVQNAKSVDQHLREIKNSNFKEGAERLIQHGNLGEEMNQALRQMEQHLEEEVQEEMQFQEALEKLLKQEEHEFQELDHIDQLNRFAQEKEHILFGQEQEVDRQIRTLEEQIQQQSQVINEVREGLEQANQGRDVPPEQLQEWRQELEEVINSRIPTQRDEMQQIRSEMEQMMSELEEIKQATEEAEAEESQLESELLENEQAIEGFQRLFQKERKDAEQLEEEEEKFVSNVPEGVKKAFGKTGIMENTEKVEEVLREQAEEEKEEEAIEEELEQDTVTEESKTEFLLKDFQNLMQHAREEREEARQAEQKLEDQLMESQKALENVNKIMGWEKESSQDIKQGLLESEEAVEALENVLGWAQSNEGPEVVRYEDINRIMSDRLNGETFEEVIRHLEKNAKEAYGPNQIRQIDARAQQIFQDMKQIRPKMDDETANRVGNLERELFETLQQEAKEHNVNLNGRTW